MPTDAALARFGYEQTTGPCAGLGGYVEAVYQSDFYLDNANLLKAPGFTVVNLNLHYDRTLSGQADAGFAKRLSLYVELRNAFDRIYTNSAQKPRRHAQPGHGPAERRRGPGRHRRHDLRQRSAQCRGRDEARLLSHGDMVDPHEGGRSP